MSRKANGAAFVTGFAAARAQMLDELRQVRQAIATDIEAFFDPQVIAVAEEMLLHRLDCLD